VLAPDKALLGLLRCCSARGNLEFDAAQFKKFDCCANLEFDAAQFDTYGNLEFDCCANLKFDCCAI
jgi:hypothetical protein